MKAIILLSFLIFLTYGETKLFKGLYKDTGRVLRPKEGVDVGTPLILTDFIRNGSISAGQRAALVQNPIFKNVKSYAGYFRVDDGWDSNLWFWFFPSADKVAEDPVVLWLNGGPGATSLNGLFDENGPFIVNEDSSVTLREYSWHKNHSLIFIDNPVGVGYSFTTKGGYAENETKVGQDMYSGLYQFFQLFPDLQNNPFYISGESYAGKFLPAIGYTIMKKNAVAKRKINLQGILIGDGWTDPINQLNQGPYVYQLGLVGSKIKKEIDKSRDKGIQLIKEGKWIEAGDCSGRIQSLIMENSRVNVYNYILEYNDPIKWIDFVNTEEIRRVLHVGNATFGGDEATNALIGAGDGMMSVAPMLEQVLEYCRVLIFAGQLDIIVNYSVVRDYVQKLNFSGAEEYRNADRNIWYVDDEVAGYVQIGGLLTEMLVRNAGHMVPKDQPKWGYDLLYKFTRNISYTFPTN